MDLKDVERIAAEDHYLAVITTIRSDGSVQASLVNAGVLPHPVSGEPAVGFVTYGKAKLAHLRARPQVTAVFRSGWQWAAVEGSCDLIGPDDPFQEMEPAGIPGAVARCFPSGRWDARRLGRIRPRHA